MNQDPATPKHSQAKGAPAPPGASARPAWMGQTGRLLTWLFGYMLPLYLIVAALFVIALPKAGPGRGQALPPAIAAPAGAPSDTSIANIAKLALDAGKERIDSVKESNDKLFSLIAALAALLVFFGFKGLETFNAAKAQAQETVERAEVALKNAEAAHELATAGIASFREFVKIEYSKNMTAEIDVVQGMILLELAELYVNVLQKCHITEDGVRDGYCNYLKYSLFFLERVTDHPEDIDKKIVCRAFVTQGYVYKRLGQLDLALRVAKTAFGKFDDRNDSAYFNAACYCCLLAAEALKKDNHRGASVYEEESLFHLRKAIELDEKSRGRALHDDDFAHFVGRSHAGFLAMVARVMPNGAEHD